MSARRPVSHNYEYIAACPQLPTSPSQFSLVVRQQPIQARQSTANERDRRPVDPPPIIQIKLEDSVPQETQDFLQNPYLFMCASLAHPVRDDVSGGISGQSVSSVFKLKDFDNRDCGFFVFGDLSIRVEGQYRIKFTLFEITLNGAVNLKSIYSDIFSVYSSKTFPGMLEPTFLSRSFSDQGVRLRIRKEHRVQMNGSCKRKSSASIHDCCPLSTSLLPISHDHVEPATNKSCSSSSLANQQHGCWPPPAKDRRLSMDLPWPTTPLSPYSPDVARQSRHLSAQQSKEPAIRLPPIRNIMLPPSPAASSPSSLGGGDTVEVDAAVAMMQLASSKQHQQHSSFMHLHLLPPTRQTHTNSAVW